MKTRRYVRSGVCEQLDARQQRLLEKTLIAVQFYYRELYQKELRYMHPLSLSLLMQLTNRSGSAVLAAVRILANTIATDESQPPLFYDRVRAHKGPKRPYRIFLRTQTDKSPTSQSPERNPPT